MGWQWDVRVRRVRLVAVFMVAFCLTITSHVWADESAFTGAMALLADPAADALKRGIDALGDSSDPRALDVLRALRDGDVELGGGRVFIRGQHGEGLHDELTGGAPESGVALRRAPIDNTVRRSLGAAIARRSLSSSEEPVRLGAIDEIVRRSGDDAAPALREALVREKSGAVQRALTAALAQLDLGSRDPARRLFAIKSIERSGSVSLQPKLRALLERRDDGTYVEREADVRAAAESALGSLGRKQLLVDTAANLLYGLSTGSVLLLAALGLAITFGLMGVINMAHGEMLMIGAYATYATQVFFRAYLPNHMELYVLAAIPAAFVASGLVGAVLERTVIRFLYGRPLETLLATWGLSLILIQTVRVLFGAQNVTVENPQWLSGGTEVMDGVVLPYNRVAVVFFSVAVVAFVAFVLTRTSFGLRMRAVTQNRPMAACMGISTARVDMWTFALGSGVGGLGGLALSQLGNVGPELGQGYIVDSFMVVVLGGVGKLAGSVVAAFILGLVNKVLEPVAGAVLGKIVVLLGIVVVIQKRPQGLFALRGRSAEA